MDTTTTGRERAVIGQPNKWGCIDVTINGQVVAGAQPDGFGSFFVWLPNGYRVRAASRSGMALARAIRSAEAIVRLQRGPS